MVVLLWLIAFLSNDVDRSLLMGGRKLSGKREKGASLLE